jgi:hypothetical protein
VDKDSVDSFLTSLKDSQKSKFDPPVADYIFAPLGKNTLNKTGLVKISDDTNFFDVERKIYQDSDTSFKSTSTNARGY